MNGVKKIFEFFINIKIIENFFYEIFSMFFIIKLKYIIFCLNVGSDKFKLMTMIFLRRLYI